MGITAKQVLFLNELEETLELTQPSEFHRIQEQLFRRLALCITCPHFQVAERTLFFWNNDYIVKLINQNRHTLYPIIIGALYTNSKQHWNSAVHGLTFNVLKLLMEADPQLFDECSAKHPKTRRRRSVSIRHDSRSGRCWKTCIRPRSANAERWHRERCCQLWRIRPGLSGLQRHAPHIER